MDSPITPALRSAVTDLIAWYDRLLEDDSSATLLELARCVAGLKTAKPYPGGQVGADIAHIIKPQPDTNRVDHVEALERLRLLTHRPGQDNSDAPQQERLALDNLYPPDLHLS